MKYRFYLILMVCLISKLAIAGTFKLDVHDSTAQGVPGDVFMLETYVHNISESAIVVNALRASNTIPENWSTSMCYGQNCYPPFVNEATELIQPGDSLLCELTFNTDTLAGIGTVKMIFSDILSGDSDSVIFVVETITPPAFRLAMLDTLETGLPGAVFPMGAYIYNESAQPIVIQATRLTNSIPGNWITSMCLGSTCYAPGVNEISQIIQPGDSLLFDITFTTDNLPDSGEALIRFTDLTGSQTAEQLFRVITSVPPPAFEVEFTTVDTTGPAGQELILEGEIYNIADSTIMVSLLRETTNIPQGWSTALCLGQLCFAPMISNVSDTIPAGGSLYYAIHFITDATPATGSTGILFTSAGSADSVRQTFTAETQTTSINNKEKNPLLFRLRANYPNPFNNVTTVSFQSEETVAQAELFIYNSSGQLVKSLSESRLAAGQNEWRINSGNLPSGEYFYTLKLTGISGKIYRANQKLILIK